MSKGKRRFGDRYDGRLVRNIDPFYKIIPYIMRSRVDAQNFFEDSIEINKLENYIKNKRKDGLKNLSFLHLVLAAVVRTISQKPRLNRFVAGRRIYARNEILISFAIKKELSEDGTETTLKVKFDPTDTLFDVVEKVNKALEENKDISAKNDTDRTARLIMMCPGVIVRFMVWLLRKLDSIGLMPKVINRVSPFHTSVFITDLGSLGIQPIYHHLYEFGTTSIFIAFGIKKKRWVVDANRNIVQKKYVDVKITTDERIVDGYYYAKAFQIFRRLLENPEQLESPPERIVEDQI